MLASSRDLRGRIDGVGIHPYGATPHDVLAGVVSARHALDVLGLREVPLYITEFGWATRPSRGATSVSERVRPRYVRRALQALGHLDCGIAMIVLFSWVTAERNRSDEGEWFGIHPPAGGSSPDSRAFAAGVRGVGRSGRRRPPCRASR
jgi:hypothetical protein